MAQSGGESSKLVIIDDDGDTLIILENLIETLRDWPSGSHDNDNSEDDNTDSESESAPESEDGEDATKTAEQADTTGSPARSNSEPKPQVRFQVSSAMLKNASEYFRNMFSGQFSESMASTQDGMYPIRAQGFHRQAMEHVMNVIHIRTRNIPKKVDLEILAHIAVLVDYYAMKETVSFHTEVWAKAVARKKFPDMYDRALVLRTFVAKTFGDYKNFKRGAEIIVRNSTGSIPDLGIPFFGLDDTLNELRQSMLQVLTDEMKQFSKDIDERKWGCSNACRAMLLGNFILESQKSYISGRNLNEIEHPFHGVSFEALSDKLSDCTDLPIWFRRLYGPSEKYQMDNCDLDDLLESAVIASKAHMRKRLEELAK